MEWQQDVAQLFDKVVLGIPEMVRSVIKSTLFEAAEKKCMERNSKNVAEVDLVVALFEITPPAFQPTMIEDLKALRVNVDLYLPKVNSDFKLTNDLNQMVKDIQILCELTEVNFNKEAIWKALYAYKKYYFNFKHLIN